jgi:hypothetical protein
MAVKKIFTKLVTKLPDFTSVLTAWMSTETKNATHERRLVCHFLQEYILTYEFERQTSQEGFNYFLSHFLTTASCMDNIMVNERITMNDTLQRGHPT